MTESSLWSWSVLTAVESISKRSLTASKELSKYLYKQIWSPADRNDLLESLSRLFIEESDIHIGQMFRPLSLDIVSRYKEAVIRKNPISDSLPHKQFCVALSRCLHWPDIERFALDYVQTRGGFLGGTSQPDLQEPKKKKQKKLKVNDEALCEAAWLFAYHLGDTAGQVITLDSLLPFLTSDNEVVRWFTCHAVMQLQHMSSTARQTFILKHFSEQDCLRLKLRYNMQPSRTSSPPSSLITPEKVDPQTHTMGLITETDLSSSVTCVDGILLTKQQSFSRGAIVTDLLPVPSNESNLYSLALAVSSGSPVLLQGVVGSGKTSLVEHLAKLTGRSGPPHLMKIQLGDQMDSKALLGTYRCTEVPGEFVWQPGVLTQAVTNGYWVLLEDIDYAPMEVVSVLLPLLETRCLSVPGHGDNIMAAPGFHLFATQRLMGGSSGWHHQQTGSSVLLEKLWTKILVEPLSRTELSQVICSKYPALSTVVDKLLDIYFLLSAGKHSGAEDVAMETEVENVGKFLSHDGRQISTRDLMNWCHRISEDFDSTSSSSSNLVFQEALDCFVACLSKPDKRMPLAEAIGAKLNVTQVKAEYFCLKYKPEVKISDRSLTVGRVRLQVKQNLASLLTRKKSTFSFTRQSSALLERVAVCVSNSEPVLLVGETGTGKTSSVQYLAEQLGHKLHVVNMNQQSDSADLLGGFKPVDLRFIIKPFYEDFELLFVQSFSQKQNAKFQGHLQECFSNRKWDALFTLMDHTTTSALKKFVKGSDTRSKWRTISRRLKQLKIQVQQTQNALAFSFIEGTLVQAIRNGDWILLDEINLAAMETLECLSGLLESTAGSVLLMERGDMEPVIRHHDFRLFACMNPATDVGKKDLSPGIRNRFTELFVDELEDSQDLKILVSDYLQGLSLSSTQVDGIVKFYLTVRNETLKKLTDGTGHQPHFSLRTLCRALRFAASNAWSSSRSLYEGFCLSFLTQLDRSSHPTVEQLICQYVIGKSSLKSLLKQSLPKPAGGNYLCFEGYWISAGELEPKIPEDYILTHSVRANLRDLARIVSAGQHPVLLQGETSVGKTSLITWLAKSSGNMCVRVNNHEHTDLQEYVGCYAADENGKLAFREGVLVEAMRKGHWIILDELNLAPTDVLEALNRLLDDNRELYIPETQETIKAHPKFMLFATQNPPGHYGGRKILSRAFRNRFVELHFDEIPSQELETILHQRCEIPLSYAKRLIAVMLELQTRRRGSGVFAGKLGFMTLRDLFRWAERYKCFDAQNMKFYSWDQHLADQGYMLLAGRVRKPEETAVIQEVIQKHFKCKVNSEYLFTLSKSTSLTTRSLLENILSQSAKGFHHIVWTQSMRRLAVLIGEAMKYKEPILLVGETGCGKTTMCQLYAEIHKSSLYSVNCHLHSESADFLGGLRPVRSHSEEDSKDKLFEWVDGPLVKAMKGGAMFLIDEISLADDSVLERLNSVLEPERTILLAEKGGGHGGESDVEQVVAKEGFQVFATMNPGGDFGKKELSPALRNRFTEIWCPPSNQRQDLIDIIEHNLNSGIHLSNQEDGTSGVGRAMMEFVDWFTNNELGKRCTVSIRDILSWVQFINTCSKTVEVDQMSEESSYNQLEPAVAYIHGACLVFLDGLGAGTTSQGSDLVISQLRTICLGYLLKQVNTITHQSYDLADLCLLGDGSHVTKNITTETEDLFCIPPFSIPKGAKLTTESSRYALNAPGTCLNAQRLLRGLQLPRPLLLEGSPGVGKTSLVGAIAKAAGRELVRINLSEQTDVTDLFGADLPVEGAEGGVFAWRDGPLLQALKTGSWIVLDELNLASQSVLEGLNACLDHRAEVYVPELGKTFHIQHEKTRLFACQNPLNQGGGRKGLPRSFLNRFTQVYVEPLSKNDLMFIASTMYPNIPLEVLSYMVTFNMKIYERTVLKGEWGQKGSPWEFNLRDLFRWCDLLLQNQDPTCFNPGEFIHLIYADRMRTLTDKTKVYGLFEEIFPAQFEVYKPTGIFRCGTTLLQVGHSFLPIEGQGYSHGNSSVAMEILHHCLEPLESLMKCVEMNWMAILVGSQSCGKSSLVQMLAALSGNSLNVLAMNSAMDTTELLGGFEQADTSRHIEEVAADVNTLVQKLCQACLLHQDGRQSLTTVARLQELWKHYLTAAKQGEKKSNLEEVESTKEQVGRLLETVMMARKVTKKMESCQENIKRIGKIKQRLTVLIDKLTAAKSGTGGGAFEWIDSLLVRSLQTGEWLLVDNVNFCSASVLDRLNALLEPGGVLSINERGVIDGEIPTIKPHPNFRLFLSMDPRHGEISRAMRNRGVEIYVPGEDDGKCFTDTELRRLCMSLGIQSKPVFDWLYTLHTSLKESLPRDKPSIQSLLEVCKIAKKQLDLGCCVQKSLYLACYNVLVQTQKNKTSKQISGDILNQHFTHLTGLTPETAVQLELGVTPVRLPDVEAYQLDPRLAQATTNIALVGYLLDSLQADRLELHDMTKPSLQIKHAFITMLNSVSQEDCSMTVRLIQNFFKQRQSKFGENVRQVVTSLEEISQHMLQVLPHSGYEEYVAALTSQTQEKLALQQYPVDLRWNIQALDRICSKSAATQQTKADFILCLNRIHILQHAMVELCVMNSITEDLQAAVEKDKERVSPVLHPAVAHLIMMYPLVKNLITQSIPSLQGLEYQKVEKLLEGLRWLGRLLEAAYRTVQEPSDQTAGQLCLHWKWFYNKTLADYSPDGVQQLSTILQLLENLLGKDDSRCKVFVKFWTHYGYPDAYKTSIEAENHTRFKKLLAAIDITQDSPELMTQHKVKAILSRRHFILQKIEFLFKSLGSQDPETQETFEQCLSALIAHFRSFDINVFHDQMETDTLGHMTQVDQSGDCKMMMSYPVDHVQLWPLSDYLGTLAGWQFVNGLLLRELDTERCEALVDYLTFNTPSSPTDLSLLKNIREDNRKECFPLILRYMFWNLRRNTSCHQPQKWLDWRQNPTAELEDDTASKRNRSILEPVVSFIMFNLLSRADNGDLTESPNVRLDAPLSRYKQELGQLSQIGIHIWSNMAVYASEKFSPRHLDRTNLLTSFSHLLCCLKPLMTEDRSSDLDTCLEEMKQAGLTQTSREVIEKLSSILTTSLPSFDSTLQQSVSHCVHSVLSVAMDTEGGAAKLGQAWVHQGYLHMQLLAPKGPVDPVERQAVKLKILKQELLEAETELEVRAMDYKLRTGQEITDVSPRLVHPRIPYLLRRIRETTVKIEQLSSKVVHRPEPSKYGQLVRDIDNYLQTVMSLENITKLLKKLTRSQQKANLILSVLQEVELWERTQDKFVAMLEEEYSLYTDVVTPFIVAVFQVVHGVGLLAHNVRQTHELSQILRLQGKKDSADYKILQLSLEELLAGVARFPTVSSRFPSCLKLAMTLTSDQSLTLANNVMSARGLETESQDQAVSQSILNCCLLHIENEALVRSEVSADLQITLTHILEKFVLSWQREEQKRREAENEAASLYRFKSQVHGDERSEEERLEQEFRDTFPLFEQDFMEFVEPTSLDDSPVVSTEAPQEERKSELAVTEAQMAMLCSIHQKLHKCLTDTEWFNPVPAAARSLSDWVEPVLTAYSAASSIGLNLTDVLDSNIDRKLLGGHLVVTTLQQAYVTDSNARRLLLPSKGIYNIYRDPNVPEVIKCIPVFHNVLTRVHQLQEDWPDHPTLKQLCDIVSRIESFPITSPVMKFLTGIELLVQKAQDWESNASQHVSMATQLGELSSLIVEWRKLELSCWSNALDTEVTRCIQGASKWWFHMYQLLQSVLNPDTVTMETEQELQSDSDIINTFKQFMEQSSLGEYHTRLDMLLSFHCHLITMETSPKQELLKNVLWNLYQFYSRFSKTVSEETARLRAPIEKELKGFVKIARWSDINYWALKQTTEKTHRTLHKFIKQFQDVLEQPVQRILGDKDGGTVGELENNWSEAVKQHEDTLLQKLVAFKMADTLEPPAALLHQQESTPLQCRLPTLCRKFNKHWRQIIRKAGYTDLTLAVDQFTVDVIEEVHELQALDVTKGADKEKQKSEAKHNNLRKRKALSDLFKYLTKLGLSYRKGLAMSEKSVDEALLVPPLDISVCASKLENAGEGQMLDVWQGCQQYYYRCISRKAQLTTALVSPSKELGIGNLERCRGFTEHLFKLVMQQYREVADLTHHSIQFRGKLNDLASVNHDRRLLIPQAETRKWMNTLRDLTVQMIEGLNQFLVILHCCPRQQEGITTTPSPLPVSQLHQMALVRAGDQAIEGVITDVQSMVKEAESILTRLPSSVKTRLLTGSQMEDAKELFAQLNSKVPTLQHIAKLFSDPDCSDQPNAFNEVLIFLSSEISQQWETYVAWTESCEEEVIETQTEVVNVEAVQGFSEEVEQLVAAVLMVVQKLRKCHVMETSDGEEKSAQEEEEEDIQDGHLVQHIVERLQKDVTVTDSSRISVMLDSLMTRIFSDDVTVTVATRAAYLSILHNCQPLLEQYYEVLHFHLVSVIATERIMGKLLSVLLGVFTELALKGFCVPPEFSDEVEGEGATEFKDIESGGLGEGEGVKDVSDQIETEDQLDDAKRPEDQKQEEKGDQADIKAEDNAIEMSDDMEGKLHDPEKGEGQEDGEEEGEEEEEELERQMGDVDEEETEKLDEQMWGSDEDDEPDSEERKEESGPGDGKQSEPELVAADDNKDKSLDDSEQSKKDNSEEQDDNQEEEKKPNNLEQLDQDNYDDDQIDPYHGDDTKEQQAPDDMDLPDDLMLDDDNDDAGKEEEQTQEDAGQEEEDTTVPPPPEDTIEDKDNENKDENKEEEKMEEDVGDKTGEDRKEEEMETDGKEREEEEGETDPGFNPQEEDKDSPKEEEDQSKEADEKPLAAENYGKTSHDTEVVEQSETAQDQAGQADNSQEEADGSGQASSELLEGHEGQRSTQIADGSTNGKRKQHQREPGKSDSDRSLGSADQKYKKLKTTDARSTHDDTANEEENKKSDLYEHIKDSKQHYDAQTLDVATAEQQEQQPIIKPENESHDSDVDDDVKMEDKELDEKLEDSDNIETLPGAKLKKSSQDRDTKIEGEEKSELADDDREKIEVPGERVTTDTVERGPESTIHTALENLHLDSRAVDLEHLRLELEDQLGAWSQSNITPGETEATASELWHRYEALTSSLSQDLCEQLRLVLEPSQATKLKGDYRTGKRLNMRKVIPYIASQFRKDKIWLRRTKPSKRQYQVMLAIDDSSSMVDNHSKQLAFESLALVSNALTLLEAGELSICSFGEGVNLLHPFTEQFTSHSGARLLQYFTFEQKKTKIAQLLKHATSIMMEARQRQHGSSGNPDTSQLLLIVSDGRGLFLEGVETVKTAVRQAREANVFLVFVVLDNPVNKDSILDIKVPVFKQLGQIPEIKSYMDSFPFRFYIILRDINSLPTVLSDALRQWFELVTAVDR